MLSKPEDLSGLLKGRQKNNHGIKMNIEESHRGSPPAGFRPLTPQPVVVPALLKQQPPADVPTQTALERTIRWHDSGARHPPFDFHFVSSDQQVRTILLIKAATNVALVAVLIKRNSHNQER